MTRRERRTERVNYLIDIDWNKFTDNEKKAIEMAYSKGKLYTKDFEELIKRSSTYARTVLNGLADKRILSDKFIDMLVNCFAHTIPHIRFYEGRMTELALRQLHLVYQYV